MDRLAWKRSSGRAIVGADERRLPTDPKEVPTKKQVGDRIDRIDLQVKSLDTDILNWARGKYGPSVWSAGSEEILASGHTIEEFHDDHASWKSWQKWRDQWFKFRDDTTSKLLLVVPALYAAFAFARYRDALKWDTEEKDWEKRWSVRGVTIRTPATVEELKGDVTPADLFSGLKTIAIGGAVIVGGILVLQAVGAARSVLPSPQPEGTRP